MNHKFLKVLAPGVSVTGTLRLQLRRGALLPLVAVTMVGLLALMALGIDGGVLQRQRRLVQNAADAGALAGAQEILRGHDTSYVHPAARLQATRNGFTNGAAGALVTVTEPTSPDYFTGSSFVKVVVVDTVRTIFAGIIGRPFVVVTGTAFGGISAPSGTCIMALDTTNDNQAIRIDAGADVEALNCGIVDNSRATGSGSQAAFFVSGATVNAAGGSISVTGSASGTTTPAAKTGIAASPNPLSYLSMPSFSKTCTYTPNGASGTLKSDVSSGTVTLSPGTYCGGLSVSGGGHAILNPGVYYLLGGGLNLQNNNTLVQSTGAGVTFVNTWDATHSYSRVNIQSGTTAILSAYNDPSNPFPGVLIYQDPTVTGSAGLLAGNANQFQSGSNTVLNGTLYFPTQDVEIHSGTSMTITGGIVAHQVWVHDNTVLNLNPLSSGSSGFFAGRRATLVQ